MIYKSQNDADCRNEIMTNIPYPNGNRQNYPDTIGMSNVVPEKFRFRAAVGCLLTSFANEIQLLYNVSLSPQELNEELIKHDGYFILNMGEDCPIAKESYIVNSVLEKLYKIKVTYNLDPMQYRNAIYGTSSERYIIKFKHKGVTHYSNILNDILINDKPYFIIFNVWNNQVEIISFHKALKIIKIVKR